MDFSGPPPQFDGDDYHELRGLQHALRRTAISEWLGRMRDAYMRAWLITGKPPDTLKRQLDGGSRVSTSPFEPSHDYLAAWWRHRHGHIQPVLPGLITAEQQSYDWLNWLRGEVDQWALWEPAMLRRMLEARYEPTPEDALRSDLAMLRDVQRLYGGQQAVWLDHDGGPFGPPLKTWQEDEDL